MTSPLLADAGRGLTLLHRRGQEPVAFSPIRTPAPSRALERPRGDTLPPKEGSLSRSLMLGLKQTDTQTDRQTDKEQQGYRIFGEASTGFSSRQGLPAHVSVGTGHAFGPILDNYIFISTLS